MVSAARVFDEFLACLGWVTKSQIKNLSNFLPTLINHEVARIYVRYSDEESKVSLRELAMEPRLRHLPVAFDSGV